LAQAELRPGLAEIALALARNVLDNPRAVASHAAAAGKLAAFWTGCVRTMTDKGDGAANRDPEIS